MRILLFLLFITTSFTPLFSQVEILTNEQINTLFPSSIQKNFAINFPIYRAYKYSDKTGQYYCLLTENIDKIVNEKDTLHTKIKAVNLKVEKSSFVKVWEINDFVLAKEKQESNIWFWTKYCSFSDVDKDGLTDPIIVYGTKGANGYDDGRIKFIIYYKGQKYAIRHQNGVLDFERETHVDKAFYSLPKAIQGFIQQKMEAMTENNQAIFPAGWQVAMQKQQTTFNERR